MTNIVVRNSELSTWRRCRQKWQWAYRDCMTPKIDAVPLRFGDLVHRALAAFYIPATESKTKIKRGPHPTLTFEELYDAQLAVQGDYGMYTEDDEWVNARELGVEMLNNYINEYGRDERYRVLAPEVPFQVDVYDDDGVFICTMVGTFDAIIYDLQTGKYGIFEHKTAKAIRTDHLPLDEQAGTYFAFAGTWLAGQGIIPEGERIDFILYNFLRKGGKDQRPVNELGQHLNKDGSVSKRQPPPLFHRELVHRSERSSQAVLHRIANQAVEIEWVDTGEMTVYKNPTRDCSYDCAFRDMCILHEEGADWEDYAKSAMTKWDPYKYHEGYLLPESSNG